MNEVIVTSRDVSLYGFQRIGNGILHRRAKLMKIDLTASEFLIAACDPLNRRPADRHNEKGCASSLKAQPHNDVTLRFYPFRDET
jgi:hypothetical protein